MNFKHIKDYFDWRKHPQNVFPIALPVAVTGFTLLFIRAILFIKYTNDWTYLAIFLAGMALLVFALHPVYKYFKNTSHITSPNASVS